MVVLLVDPEGGFRMAFSWCSGWLWDFVLDGFHGMMYGRRSDGLGMVFEGRLETFRTVFCMSDGMGDILSIL